MIARGTQKYGISIVYKNPYEPKVGFSNLSRKETLENIEYFGEVNWITTSRANKKSEATDTPELAKANLLRFGEVIK